MIRVVFAEDNYLVREGTAALLGTVDEVELVGTATDRDGLLAAVEEHRPDAVLTDIRMPPTGTNEGIEAAKKIRAEHPEIGVVVLSQFAEEDYAYDLLKDGAAGLGYLLKERVADVDELVRALSEVAAAAASSIRRSSRRWLRRRTGWRTPRSASSPTASARCWPHMAQGENNAAIATSLFLTERAVEKHINSLFHKLGLTEEPDVHRRVMAVLAFLRETDARLSPAPARPASLRLPRVHDEHAARRVPQHQRRHGVPDAPPAAVSAPVADHDRVRGLLGRHLADRLGRLASLDPDAGGDIGEAGGDPREVRAGIRGAVGIDDCAEIGLRTDVKDEELCSSVARQSGGVLDGEVGRRRGVGSYQDRRHRGPPSRCSWTHRRARETDGTNRPPPRFVRGASIREGGGVPTHRTHRSPPFRRGVRRATIRLWP